jgi:hypothetical protein
MDVVDSYPVYRDILRIRSYHETRSELKRENSDVQDFEVETRGVVEVGQAGLLSQP